MNSLTELWFCLIVAVGAVSPAWADETSQPGSKSGSTQVLGQCRAQAASLDQVHACMDGYLNQLDSNMAAMTELLSAALDSNVLAGFERSQQAFMDYREQNCLWYLEFSGPREDAEQIAKDCLVNMTVSRLNELNSLTFVSSYSSPSSFEGYYVYDSQDGSFQPCGSEQSYRMVGEANLINMLQQSYLSLTDANNQSVYITVTGRMGNDSEAVFDLERLLALSLPSEADCNTASEALPELNVANVDVDELDLTREVTDDERVEQEEPEQQLTAYFGAWLVDCIERAGRKTCDLQVKLQGPGDNDDALLIADTSATRLILVRAPRKSTSVEVFWPGREVDTPARLRWQVDQRSFGDIIESEIRVDQLGTRQLIGESEFLDSELLPQMMAGDALEITVLETPDDDQGERFASTLLGLTRALEFADGFMLDGV